MAAAVIELDIAITQLRNVDLFEKGYYATKCYIDPVKGARISETELQLPVDGRQSGYDELATAIGPGKLMKGNIGFKTLPCLVQYSDDQFDVRTGIKLRIDVPISSTTSDFTEQLDALSGDLHVELWFHPKDVHSMKRVSKKLLKLHHLARPGIKFGGPITFDFFYTCSVDLTVSSMLLGFDVINTSLARKHSLIGVVTNPERPTGSRLRLGGSRKGESYEISSSKTTSQDTQTKEAMSKRLRVLGVLMVSTLLDLKQQNDLVGLGAAAATVGHSLAAAESALAAGLERLEMAAEGDLLVGEFWRFLNETYRLGCDSWDSVRDQYMYSRPVFAILKEDSRLHSIEQLEHGYYVLEHPARGLLDVTGSRGTKLCTLADSLRGSRFFKVLSPSWVEDTTDTISPRLGPLLAEYRTFCGQPAFANRPRVVIRPPAYRQQETADAYTAALEEFRKQIGSHAQFLSESAPGHPEASVGPAGTGTGTGKGHLVVCVHGLSGNQYDLRCIKLHLLRALPDLDFLMSSCNQDNTHASFVDMTQKFSVELMAGLDKFKPSRVSFIGHSLGNIIIRSALSHFKVQARFQLPADMVPDGAAAAEAPPGSGAKIGVPTLDVSGDAPDAMVMSSPRLNRKCPAAAPPTKPVLQTFISLAAPHLGAVYLGGMVSTGMWFLSKWKRSSSLSCLAMTDTTDPRNAFLYRLSKTNSMQLFRTVVLQASPHDKYVHLSSALIHPCAQSAADSKLGPLYEEMARNLIDPLVKSNRVNIVRLYLMTAPGPKTIASIIGRAAHIACLDDDHVAQKVAVGVVRYLE